MKHNPEGLPSYERLSYHDVLRELSAAFRVKPEDVSRVLDSISSLSRPNNGQPFLNGFFTLRHINGNDGKQRVMLFLQNGQGFCLEVVPYKGLVKMRAELDQFGELRIIKDEKSRSHAVPDARPSDPCAATPLSDPFNELDFDDNEISPSTQRKVLGALEGPDSFRGLIFEEDEDAM